MENGTTFALMGRMNEAQACVKRALELNPNLSIESWGKGQLLYRDTAYTERILDGLRKAGLPEKTTPITDPRKQVAGL